MFKKFNIQAKIFLLLATVTSVSIAFMGYVNYVTSMQAHTTDSYNSLTAIREMKAMQVEDYMKTIRNQITTFSEDKMIVNAMKDFNKGYIDIVKESNIDDASKKKIQDRVNGYYKQHFFTRLSKNSFEPIEENNYLPTTLTSLILQDTFISNNRFKTGEKDKLIGTKINTSYGRTHQKYHPIIKNYLDKFGYYDIFLVDTKSGSIVYSVFKEVDFATSLKDGPYSKTNFAEVFNTANNSKDKNFVKLVDFKPYQPSYNDNASFIASPIYDGDEKIGVLVFQMPVEKINNIMTNHHNWKNVGLGESGETYIVGDDYTLRNESRFFIEDRENYLKMISSITTSKETIQKISNLNNSIGLQTVKTKGTISALNGKTGTEIFEDYRGVSVLSSYKPLYIEDVNWVIMSEIDEEEVFSDVRQMREFTIFLFIMVFLVVILLSLVFSRRLVRPLKYLQNSSNELASGNLEVKIDVRGHDEIANLATSFNTMKNSIKKLLEVFDTNIIASKSDKKGIITYASKAFVEISEYPKDELVGQNHSIVRHPDMSDEVFTDLWKTISSGKTWRGEIKNLKKNGGYYWVDAIISPEFDESGEITGYSAIRHDITAKKEIEELSKTLEKKVQERTQEIKEAYDELDEYKDQLEVKVEEEIKKRQETMLIKNRMEGELNIAHDIQMSMIPLLFPVFTDHKEFSIFADIKPAREVGGDFYDFYFIDNDHICLVIGDVSGKGVPAALFMAVAKTLIKSRASNDLSPASVISYVNEEMSVDNPASMFVTLFIGVLDLNSGEMRYTNAGHNPPYIIRNDTSLDCLNDRHGPIVGAMDGLAYNESSIVLEQNDKLLLYTDGVTEAMNVQEELFGEKKLENYLVESQTLEVKPLIKGLMEAVHNHEAGSEQSDDITILAFEFFTREDIESYDISISNNIDSLSEVLVAFESFSEKYTLAMPISQKMSIALDDLLNNIISYAYVDDKEHTIDIRFEYNKDMLCVVISDDGIPFNPFDERPADTTLSMDEREIGGLGIHLIKNMIDECSYSRKINKNIVTLRMYLSQTIIQKDDNV